MPEKKKPSKFKKIVKNLLKAATLGTIGYGAAKMFGGPKAVRGVYPPGMNSKLAMLGEGVARPYQDDIMRGGTGMTLDKTDRPWWKFKKGGRVTGIAKRGFGRALMKGKK